MRKTVSLMQSCPICVSPWANQFSKEKIDRNQPKIKIPIRAALGRFVEHDLEARPHEDPEATILQFACKNHWNTSMLTRKSWENTTFTGSWNAWLISYQSTSCKSGSITTEGKTLLRANVLKKRRLSGYQLQPRFSTIKFQDSGKIMEKWYS